MMDSICHQWTWKNDANMKPKFFKTKWWLGWGAQELEKYFDINQVYCQVGFRTANFKFEVNIFFIQ